MIKANGSAGTIYARSAGSDTLSETDLSGNFQNEYIYFNGKRLARRDASGQRHYYFSDMLGSSSVTANESGGIENVEDFYPYGLSRQLITNVPQNYQFTGKERDSESGLDDFGARFYSSYWGRFMTPDPSNWGVDFYNPQTWNHYSYVGNNPLSNTDPNGLWLTPTHNSIIDNAFPGLSKQERQILKTSSKQVDEDQSQEGSYKHGMSSEDNDPYSSTGAYNPKYDTDDFIEQNEHNAQDIQADWIASGHTGIAPAALAAFGNAAHTIADEYSPAHQGFQKVNHWTIGWHLLRETTLFGLHKKQQQDAAGAIQSAFFNTFGTNLGDQATHEKVTVTIIFDPNQKLPDQQQ